MERFGRVEGPGDADGLARRMRTGPRAPFGLAWSPRPRRKVEKTQLIHSHSHSVNQSPPAGQVTHINSEHAADTYIYTHLEQACPHGRESIFS